MVTENNINGQRVHTLNGSKILFVDGISEFHALHIAFKTYNFQVFEAASSESASDLIPAIHPDVVLIDLDLPGLDAVAFMQSIRELVPVVILSVSNEDHQAFGAIDAGADDYIVKPFTVEELRLRVKIALKHASVQAQMYTYVDGDLYVDFAHRMVTVSGEVISLTPIEYDLLRLLITHLNKPVTHEQIWQVVWQNPRGYNGEIDAHTIRVHMSNLRHKLETNPAEPKHILTESGIGYRFQSSSFLPGIRSITGESL